MNDEQLAADIKRVFGRYRMEAAPVETPLSLAPAHPPLHRRRILGGLSLAGIAAAVVLAFALTFGLAPGGNQPRSAYAGWQPIPTKTDEAMRASAEDQCLPGFGDGKSMPLVVQDQRGPFALFVFGSDGNYMSCILVPNGHGGYDADRVGIEQDPKYSGFMIDHFGWMFGSGQRSDMPPEVTLIGLTDASKVVVLRQDGVAVEATVSSGIFVAWWPGSSQASTLVAYDRGGVATASMRPFATPCICRVEPSAPNAGN